MTSIAMHDGRVVLHQADCRDVLRGLADNSIDSVVTDPPYALVSIQKRFGKPGSSPVKIDDPDKSGCIKAAYARASAGFMGKQWDTGEVAFSEEFWAEVLRVLKPGGHVVAFSGTRTYHRMAVAIEDAGFEIRDQLGWVYGSGFPKSHNQHGNWEGWGTALKPAWEPICLARKPLAGTVAANLAEWGVGAVNVDGCRVGDEVRFNPPAANSNNPDTATGPARAGGFGMKSDSEGTTVAGRWPANIVHDGSDEVLAAFPSSKSTQGKPRGAASGDGWDMTATGAEYNDEGSAARFFYCAKASRADRDAGLEQMEKRPAAGVGALRDGDRTASQRANTHPTVKPTTLMQWLARLVTPPGGVILDPFMGSGSTGKAAVLEGFQFIGCEREDEYMPIATARIAWAIGAVSKEEPQPEERPAVAQAQPAANDNDLFSALQVAA